MIPTPASTAAGSTGSSGFRRKALRMICTVATCGRAIAVSASSTRLDADPVGGDPALVDELVERVEDPVVGVDGGGRAVQLDEVERVDAEVRAMRSSQRAEVVPV